MTEKSPFDFKNIQYSPKFHGSMVDDNNMLFNKKKISNDVLSMSSSSSKSSSSASVTSESDKSSSSSSSRDVKRIEDDSVSESGSSENSYENDNNYNLSTSKYDKIKKDKDRSMMEEINEKRELLYQMDRLQSKGYKLPFHFDMDSNINDMKTEYNKLIKEKEIDASIRFQRKMLVAFVTGTEYLNTRYDPFAIRLEGWSEQVHENIQDYDEVFEELHEKYKSTGKKMSPELRLFISLSGSAFMFHLTSRMFKENPLPDVENVLKSNPELMKQFQNAAAKQYIIGNNQPQRNHEPQQQPFNSGLFGMVGNLFNNIAGGPSRPQMYDDELSNDARTNQYNTHKDIDSIINNVHNKISLRGNDTNNIETLSVSDEEITSIIEDTADIKILKNSKNKNSRTLNL